METKQTQDEQNRRQAESDRGHLTKASVVTRTEHTGPEGHQSVVDTVIQVLKQLTGLTADQKAVIDAQIKVLRTTHGTSGHTTHPESGSPSGQPDPSAAKART